MPFSSSLCVCVCVHIFINSVPILQMDRRSGKPKIWMYKDKITGKPKGEATVTYDDANAARSAIDWFDGVLCD